MHIRMLVLKTKCFQKKLTLVIKSIYDMQTKTDSQKTCNIIHMHSHKPGYLNKQSSNLGKFLLQRQRRD